MNLLAPLANLFRTPAERDRDGTLAELEKRLKGAERKVREAYDYADTVVSDWEREREMNRRQPGYRGDRKDGDNWPFLTNMEDLRRYRGMSREACEGNGYGAGILDRAVDFVIGDGMQVEVTLKGPRKGAVATGVADADGDGRPDADKRVDEVVQIIDEFRELNDWGCGEEDREEEGFRRSQRDAEVCARFFRGGSDTNGIPRARWVEPEQIDAPPSALRNERWGIRTDPDDVETKQAFYAYDLEGTGGEWIDAAEIVWHKLGTDRTVLRGMPQFWLVAEALRQCDRLNSACAEVSAIQAQIAYVREHAPGVLSGQITDFVGSSGDVTGRKATPYGDKYRRVGYGENGTVVDMSAGMKFTAGPVSQGVPAFVSALQSRLRQVCARFGYPEFFTGDACLSEDSQMLTRRGWVGVHDLKSDDEIGTVNPDTHALEYQRPSKVWQSHRNGPMVHLKTSRFDLLVTPNHDLYTTRLAPSKPNWHKVRADELAASPPVTFGCLSAVSWEGGESPEEITIPGLGTHPAADVLRLLGIYVGDGSVASNGSRVTIGGVSKPRKIKAYAEAAERFGFKCCVGKDGRHTWYTDNRELNAWLVANVGTECKDKRLPQLVWGLSAAALSPLWDGLMESDGYKPKGKKSSCYVTVSEALADDVQLVAMRLGFCAAVKRNKPGVFGHLDVFKVNVKEAGVPTLRANNVSTVEGYDGIVWCVTVPNGLIVSRRNGKVAVSGNSNGNYASLLAAGGPAERAFKRRQHKYAAFQAAVFKRACEYAVQAGRLSRSTLAAVDIKVKPGKVSVSNNLEDAQIDQIMIQNKVKSVQTVMAERGLDPRVETANLQAFDDKFGGGAMGMGGDDGDPFGGGAGSQLLEPTGESYTDGEYEVLSEAQKNLLVKKMVTDKNGNTVMRWVSAGGTMSDKSDPGTRRAELIKAGDKRKTVSRKSDTPKSDTPKAEPKVPAKTRDQLDYLPKDSKRLTVDQAEKGLSDLGYTGVKWDGDVTTATDPSGAKQSLRPVDVKRILYGDAAVPKASRMSVEDLSRAYTQAGGGKILGPAKGEPLTKPKAYRVKTSGGAESVVTAGEILKAVVTAGLARESYREDQYDLLSEADRSGLVRKNLGTDKRGRKIVRWVRPDADGGGLSRGKVGDIRSALDAAVKDPASLTPQSLALVEAHVGDLTAAEKRQYAKALKAANRKPEPPKTAADVKPPQVSADEAKAFYDYSEDVGYDLNATLRDGDTPSGRERQVYDAVSRVISERGKIDPPVKVYRALSWSHPEDRAEFLKGVSAGGEVTLGGLQSTSLDRGFVESAFGERRGGAVVMEIVANRGVRMAGDMTAHESQKEVLLPHGGKYRVVGVEEAGGKTVLKLVQL